MDFGLTDDQGDIQRTARDLLAERARGNLVPLQGACHRGRPPAGAHDEGQHSLWPAGQPTPPGGTVAHDTDSRASCLEYIEQNWTDMRPNSLIRAQGDDR